MKKLDLDQMGNLEGGLSNRQCFLAGVGLMALAGGGFWGPFIGVTIAAADCF